MSISSLATLNLMILYPTLIYQINLFHDEKLLMICVDKNTRDASG